MKRALIVSLMLVFVLSASYFDELGAELSAPQTPYTPKIDGVTGHVPIDEGKTEGVSRCPATSISLPLTMTKQQGFSLCWAAVTEMAMAPPLFPPDGKDQPQCQQVNDAYGKSLGCCERVVLSGGTCDITGLPRFDLYNFNSVSGLIDEWYMVTTYLCQKKSPFLYEYQYGANPRHIIIAYGYDGSNNYKRVFVVDPGDPILGFELYTFPFDDYFTGAPDDLWKHQQDTFDICPISKLINGACPFIP